jgi:hypothetical protein
MSRSRLAVLVVLACTLAPATASLAASGSAPSAPASLAATAGDRQVALTWSPSAGTVRGYYVYRNGARITTVGSSTVGYTNTGLVNGTTYSYYVVAYNRTGSSAPSATVSATPATPSDTTAPSSPANLTASAGDGQVTLSWTASSDNIGVAGYYVYRDNTRVAVTSSTGFSDTGLVDGTTYSYTVLAYDAAGNVSGASNAAPATPTASGSSGTTYYVSPSGSDSGVGSQSAPWRTIGHAAAVAGAGSTVLIGSGSYGENVTLSVSGSASSPITFQAAAGASVSTTSLTIKASHVAVKGLTIAGASGNCVTIQYALSDVTLSGNQITNCGADGVSFVRPGAPPSNNYTSNVLVQNNTISNVGTVTHGSNIATIYANYLTVQGNDLSVSPNDVFDLWGDHLTFRQNNIHDISNSYGHHNDVFQSWTGINNNGLCTPGTSGCDDGAEGNPVTNLVVDQNRITTVLGSNAHGFMLSGPGHNNWTIRNNIFNNIGSSAAIIGTTESGCSSPTSINVYNNTFYNAGSMDAAEFNCNATGAFANNIVMNGVGVYVTSGVRQGYNLFYNVSSASLTGTGDKTTNPNLTNPSGGDFTEASTSPAIQAGDNGSIDPIRPYDYAGRTITGNTDIGAYQH